MTKWTSAFTVMALALIPLAAPARADVSAANGTMYENVNPMTDRTNRNDFGVQLAGGFSNEEIDDAFYVGASYSHGMNPWWALGIEAGWQESDFDTNNDNDLSMVTVFGDIIGRINPENSPVVPYGVLGLGVLHAYTDTNSNDDDETAFAAKFGLGVDWFLDRNWILNVEGAYIATGADIRNGTANTENLDHWRFGGGLKYAF